MTGNANAKLVKKKSEREPALKMWQKHSPLWGPFKPPVRMIPPVSPHKQSCAWTSFNLQHHILCMWHSPVAVRWIQMLFSPLWGIFGSSGWLELETSGNDVVSLADHTVDRGSPWVGDSGRQAGAVPGLQGRLGKMNVSGELGSPHKFCGSFSRAYLHLLLGLQ